MSMTCLSCRSSIRKPSGVMWCQFANRATPAKPCVAFEYEPGTDEVTSGDGGADRIVEDGRVIYERGKRQTAV